MSFFPKVDKWVIPSRALAISREEMAKDGQSGNEGSCLWLGTKGEGEAHISHVVLLRGVGIKKHPLNVTISPELMREVHEHADRVNKILVAQVHSHGPYSGTDFSRTDHLYGVKVPYFLSIVWPDYALSPNVELQKLGIHVFIPNAGYIRLQPEGILQQIEITPGGEIETIIAEL